MNGGGIFDGNVLGSLEIGSFGCRGLGANPQVPWWCWDTSGFKKVHATCTSIQDPNQQAICISETIKSLCPWDKPPASTPPASIKEAVACNSDFVIRSVQKEIGTDVDGKWGPKSEAALKASGKTFQQIAVGCKPPVPTYSAGGGTSPTPPTPPTPPAPVDPNKIAGEKNLSKSGFSDIYNKLPPIAWLGIAGIAGLLLLKSSKKKQQRGV